MPADVNPLQQAINDLNSLRPNSGGGSPGGGGGAGRASFGLRKELTQLKGALKTMRAARRDAFASSPVGGAATMVAEQIDRPRRNLIKAYLGRIAEIEKELGINQNQNQGQNQNPGLDNTAIDSLISSLEGMMDNNPVLNGENSSSNSGSSNAGNSRSGQPSIASTNSSSNENVRSSENNNDTVLQPARENSNESDELPAGASTLLSEAESLKSSRQFKRSQV